ncbi:hypothetical protein J2Y69_002485 [Microbacterium resistens]|uniref:Uncharacterized protein n=1 Tax=Microbacterium resistens TaxID=156977 RepID=A0ABU1SG90_9MICO|nr:hypothetical protein [Microbacterium resistens]MDR6867877.1 hypothetical protein [Microbacterium resistens]
MTVIAATGEVVEVRPVSEDWAHLRARAERMRDVPTETPAEIDAALRHLEQLGFQLADLLLRANEERYAAEVAHSKRKNAALAKHGRTERIVTVARALAEQDAETELTDWLAKKAICHHIEDIKDALARKHFGLMNTNKGIQGMAGLNHRRTP